MATKQWSYIGKGRIYLGKVGSQTLRPIGNASQLEIEAEEDEQRQQDYQSAGGGAANVVTRIDSVSASMTMLELSPENIALALRGESSEKHGDSPDKQTETVDEAELGTFVPLHNLPKTGDDVITVTKDPGGEDEAELTEGDDYVVYGAGIWINESPEKDVKGKKLEIKYTPALSSVIEAMTSVGDEYRMFFDGLNEAQGGRRVAIDLHRVKFSPAESLPFIGDEFAEVETEAEVLRDPSITDPGYSPFMQVHMAHGD